MIDFTLFALSIVIAIYIIFNNRNKIRELTSSQIIVVGFSYLITVFIAFICIYYGGNWIAEQFSIIIFKYIIFLIIVFITIYFCKSILRKMINKITNGVLPGSWK